MGCIFVLLCKDVTWVDFAVYMEDLERGVEDLTSVRERSSRAFQRCKVLCYIHMWQLPLPGMCSKLCMLDFGMPRILASH
eukprot:13323853-Ditylum_brightwellii.AAC.1